MPSVSTVSEPTRKLPSSSASTREMRDINIETNEKTVERTLRMFVTNEDTTEGKKSCSFMPLVNVARFLLADTERIHHTDRRRLVRLLFSQNLLLG